jgi:hypothetical protein
MLPEAKLTFKDLADWYLDLVSVKRLASYARVKGVLTISISSLGIHLQPISSPSTWSVTRIIEKS